MTIKQLTKLAAFYGCHITPGTFYGTYHAATVIEIHDPTYAQKQEIRIGELERKQASDIVPILEQLSGKKTADLWEVKG